MAFDSASPAASLGGSGQDHLADQGSGHVPVRPERLVTGDGHDQIESGQDQDILAAEASGKEPGRAGPADHPPVVAILGGTRWSALDLGGRPHILNRDELSALPSPLVEVEVAELGEVPGGELQEAAADLVALGGPGTRRTWPARRSTGARA